MVGEKNGALSPFSSRIVIGEHIAADKILELAPQARKQILYLLRTRANG